VGSPYLTGDTDTLCGQSVPHRRHIHLAVLTSQDTYRYSVGNPYLTGDTYTLCGQSVPHRKHRYTVAVRTSQETQIHCGQSIPHRRHRYTVGSPYLTGDTQIHCVGSPYLTGDTDTLWAVRTHRRHIYTVWAVRTSRDSPEPTAAPDGPAGCSGGASDHVAMGTAPLMRLYQAHVLAQMCCGFGMSECSGVAGYDLEGPCVPVPRGRGVAGGTRLAAATAGVMCCLRLPLCYAAGLLYVGDISRAV
jgi:hypothetical protein